MGFEEEPCFWAFSWMWSTWCESEPANWTFKPLQKLSLVEAAKYDVATMMWQETQTDLFERNLLKCSGHGPSNGVRDSRECAHQMKVAADFVNIFGDHGAVMMEAEKAINPATYVQKKGTHRAPVSKTNKEEIGNHIGKTGGGKSKGKGKKIKKGKQLQDGKTLIDEEQLQAKCVIIMEIIYSDLVPEAAISIVKNPSFIIKAEWNIRKCKGCKKEITKEEKA